jgi:putative sigma-54 modulation protein
MSRLEVWMRELEAHMRIDITGRHVEVTPALRQLIEKRLAKLGRLLNDSVVSANVIVTKEKYRHRTELVVHARGDHTLSGVGEGNAWPLSIRQATEKVEQQASKLKSKWAARKRRSSSRRVQATPAEAAASGGARRVIRATRYAVKPMSVEDAALRVDDDTETFVVFRNADTDAISILYRRKDGNLGLIEPD